MKPLFSGVVVLDHVGRRWRFKQPIKFLYSVMPDYTLFVESKALGIVASGHGWRAIFHDIDMKLFQAWMDFALEDDDYLQEDGIKLKKALLDNVRFIGAIPYGNKT